MECITHFSHEHPLNFFQLTEFEDPKPHKCAICGLPILFSPSYSCSIDANCNFFLHKPCTQLPQELYHYGHCDTLSLVQRGEGEPRQTFAYKCSNYSMCKFELHPLAAKAVEIKSKHISHNSHPLVLFCREMSSQCDVCGEEQKGFFFYCQECDFWVHQDCTILPTIVKLRNRRHPFILIYSNYFLLDNSTLGYKECFICGEPWRLRHNGVYFCCESFVRAHVTCAKSNMENLQTRADAIEVIQLPEEEDASPSMVIRRVAERNPSNQLVHHNKPLILVDGSNIISREAAACGDFVCDVCVQPLHISSPFYRCQSDGCRYLAHHICANQLPTSIQVFDLNMLVNGVQQMQEYSEHRKTFFCSVFLCLLCRRPSNGLSYRLLSDGNEDEDEELEFLFCDIECLCSPKIIKHASHRQHLLYQMLPVSRSLIPVASCCSVESLPFDTYRCSACKFSIHIRCALLPKRTRHNFDEHPLELIMSHAEDTKKEVFCEVCEQQIELKFWHYGCEECEQYFHINCIPSVGYLSKVKFGKTLADDNIHPNHPLTLTRMHTHGRHERCGLCNQIIKGFAHDQMAFHCSACDFWIHFSCASATTPLTNYLTYQQQLERDLRRMLPDGGSFDEEDLRDSSD